MNPLRLHPSFLVSAAFALLLLAVARAGEPDTAVIRFSDASTPGTLKVSVARGDVIIQGADVSNVSVKTELQPEASAQRKDGLRVLSSSSSYSLYEKDNVVTLTYGTQGWGGNSSDFVIQVPRSTAVIINSSFGGDVKIGQITGNIEVKCLNGEVTLSDLAGGALVETMNGEIKASVRELIDGKPLSFTSMNGEVNLNLPTDAKANLRLRTHNGSILTDFDEKSLVAKTESVRPNARQSTAPRAVVVSKGTDDEIAAAVQEAVRAGTEAAQEAAAAVHDAAIAARDAVRAERDRRSARRGRDNDEDSVMATAPLPPLPPMTGGKIVTGTLNGGGAEISIATMNGDVTVRKLPRQGR